MKKKNFNLEEFSKLKRKMEKKQEEFCKLIENELCKRTSFKGDLENNLEDAEIYIKKCNKVFRCGIIYEGILVNIFFEVFHHFLVSDYYSLEDIYIECIELNIRAKRISRKGMQDFNVYAGKNIYYKVKVS